MSTPFRLQLPRNLHEEMIAQALAERPNECCGLLAGVWEPSIGIGRVTRRLPLVNEAASPKEYLVEKGLFPAFRTMRELEIELLAIYHSHPTSDPTPSKTDLERNYYGPEVMFLIISLKGTDPAMRGWRLLADHYEEAEWEII